jgi:hypothetical protein
LGGGNPKEARPAVRERGQPEKGPRTCKPGFR